MNSKRKIISLLILSFFLLPFSFCSQHPDIEKITILYWNDFHAAFDPYPASDDSASPLVSGSAFFSAYLDSLKKKDKNVILVCAGDELVGSPLSTIAKGKVEFELLNMIQPDVFELGNHEFDNGLRNLEDLIKSAKFPIICANVVMETTGIGLVAPYVTCQRGETRIAFLGLDTDELKEVVTKQATAGLKVKSVKKTLKEYLRPLKKESDFVILVSHMGYEGDKKIAKESEGINVIIGGHSHTLLKNPEVINQTIICQAGSRGRYIGKLDLILDSRKDKILNYDNELIETRNDKVTPDTLIQAKIDSLEKKLAPDLEKVIGRLSIPWKRNFEGESNLGNWNADVMREYTKADVAFINSGGMRKNLSKGPIRVKDIWEINPFSDNFVSFYLTGEELLKALEINCSADYELMQVSGVKYVYDAKGSKGKRITDSQVKGKPLVPEKKYKVTVNDYMLDHSEKFIGIGNEKLYYKIYPELDRDIYIKAVKKQKVIASKIEGRIKKIE
jgi:5'-nucleotidase / UDP-sugar diphosphatase